MKKQNLLGIMLSLTVGVACLAALLLKTFFPRIILPAFDALTVVVLSLAALLLDCYVSKQHERNYPRLVLYSSIIFGAFPYLSGLCTMSDIIKLVLLGGIGFTLIVFFFDNIIDRLSTGPASKLAPIFGAFGIYLALQCLMGII